jgi:hypothetical protein
MRRKLAQWAALASVVLAATGCSEPSLGQEHRVGTYEVWNSGCGQGASLSLQLAYVPQGFEVGDGIGWGLAYRYPSKQLVWLYNNGMPNGDYGLTASKYVGWTFDGESFTGTGPTYVYTPMPAALTDKVVVFAPAAGLLAPERAPDGDPSFMNIFVDPSTMSTTEFSGIASCLSSHRTELNSAIGRLPGEVPEKDRRFLHVLQLGGIAYELPPFADPAFMNAVAKMRSARTFPNYGDFFVLYPGNTVAGKIAGRAVKLTAVGKDHLITRLEVDGVSVTFKRLENGMLAPRAQTNVDGVSIDFLGDWIIDGPDCAQVAVCRATISMIEPHNSDRSESFLLTN